MGLNIKNERVHGLAREVARRTGTTQTSAIETALQQRLASLDVDDDEAARRRRLLALLAEIETTTTDDDRTATRSFQEEMYDDLGIPR